MNGGRSGGAGLACSFVILAVLAGVLALTAGGAEERATADPDEAGAAPVESLSRRELTRIAVDVTPSVARRVAELRGLEFDELPEPEVVTSEFLNRLSRREERRTGAVEGIGVDEAELRITGMLAPDEQLEGAFGSTGDLAAAAYDPRTDRLYVVSDASSVPNRALVEFLLAHELDHALEDQNFGIGGGTRLSGDGSLARGALIEGLATAVMQEYGTSYLDPFDLIAGADGIDTGNHGVPQVLVDALTWTYLGGNDYVSELRELADGWKLVDYALRSRPPATTEQVLHPEKYVRNELPDPVRVENAALREAGYRLADHGELGELQTSHLLRVGADNPPADLGAEGWNGDRYELWRAPGAELRDCVDPCRQGLVFVIRWSWDSDADSRDFDRAAGEYIESGLDGAGAAPGVWSLDSTAVAIGSGSTTSALVFAPSESLAREVASAQLQGSSP